MAVWNNRYSQARNSEPTRMVRFAHWMVLIGVLVTTSGCMTGVREYFRNGFKVGPNYCKPAAPTSPDWIDSSDERLSSEPADLQAWWTVFDDPCLNECVRLAYSENLTVREAGFRVMEARALRRVAAGDMFPQSQLGTGSFTRTQLSDESGFGGLGGGGGQINVWQMGGQLAWELDFWGRFRRAIEAADANLDATVESYDDVLVILIADVASTYVEIRTLQKRIEYAQHNVESLSGSLRIATDLFEGGSTSKLDVAQAQTNLSQTEALVPQLQTQLRQAENRLCVLMGRPPADLSTLLSMSAAEIPSSSPEVVVGIPAELIRRRPDIRQAERLVAQQSALIGVAESDLYPAFSITGNLGYQAPTFSRLFKTSAFTDSVAPGFNWNLLNYGRIRNNVIAEQALFQQRVAQYQNTVLEAQREAEDAIVAFLRSQEQAIALRQSVDSAVESRDLVQEQYRAGRTDFGRVFVAESSLVTQQDSLAVAEGQIASNLVEIYRALGGGWEIRLNPTMNMATAPIVVPGPVENVPVEIEIENEPTPAMPPEASDESLLKFPTLAIQ
ncbi:efflux transporter outer membrane subunit [Aeoliella mucimassa]|uniref:Outer membrane protein OprM n=1 Tax=Aeoliella mucimassa TaxID=2527972 RepID=A0A518AQN6_9BACT|nr:efflux transporter outer membrane subunit [Aeoliella mucimassa]QDU57027.1 Outer membrane protein OprM precursor [Aeoliella mucimassa]